MENNKISNHNNHYHKNKYVRSKKKKNYKGVFCGNCGKCGHIYKECKQPIISLGIILYRINNKKREYLLIMRKDTLGYVELIRGNYPLNDLSYLKNIIEEMTITEKKKLQTENFETLWNNLWVENEEKKMKYRSEFYKSLINFTKLSEGIDIDGDTIVLNKLLGESKSKWKEPEWGFPKGRRNLREKDLACALREFEEETDIKTENIKVLKNIQPFTEEFVGSNNKIYKHIYYIAQMLKIEEPAINSEKSLQVIEIGDIKWLSLEEALTKIRQYDIEKKNVLKSVDDLLRKYDPIK